MRTLKHFALQILIFNFITGRWKKKKLRKILKESLILKKRKKLKKESKKLLRKRRRTDWSRLITCTRWD